MQKLINRTQSLDSSHSMYQSHSRKFQPTLIQVPHCTAQEVYWYVLDLDLQFIFYCVPFSGFKPQKPTTSNLQPKLKAPFQRMFLHLYFQIILFFFHLVKYILVSTNKTIPRLICGINHHFEPFSFLAPVKGFSGSFWIKIYVSTMLVRYI